MSSEPESWAEGNELETWEDIMTEMETWPKDEQKEFLLALQYALEQSTFLSDSQTREEKPWMDLSSGQEARAFSGLFRAMGVLCRHQKSPNVETVRRHIMHAQAAITGRLGIRISMHSSAEAHEGIGVEGSAPITNVAHDVRARLQDLGVYHQE